MKAVEIEGQRLCLLKNPWGKYEWSGPWSKYMYARFYSVLTYAR